MTTAETPSHPLVPYVPRIAARWLDEHASARHQVVDGTLVSADISGFTALSEKLADRGRAGAEEVVAVVNGCFEEMIGAATRYGGDILKFGGDALLILFDGEGHASRAAVACAEVRRVVDQPRQSAAGPVDLSMSIGLHSGAFDLFLGRGRFAELIVTGPAATETIRCESDAEAGQILASAETARAVDATWHEGPALDDGRVALSPPVDVADLHVELPAPPTEHLPGLVPQTLLDHLDQGGLQGEVRPVTTAFIGFSGIDEAIRQQGPRRVARTLENLVEVVSQACEAYNVHWLDTDVAADGGKIHLTAGAPTATPDDDGAMLHAVRAILDTCPDPPLSAGLNHGNVFVGDVGSPTRRTLAAMGDSVNLAARLSGRASAGQLVATIEVIEGSVTPFDAEPLEPFKVKGKSRPILAGIVGHVAAPSTDGPTDSTTTPFVARDEELARLQEALGRAKEGRPQVVLLRGPGGMGKTRLAQELQRVEADVRVLSATCDPYQHSTPFVPLRDLLSKLIGIGVDDTPGEAGDRLMTFVEQFTPSLRPWTPLLAMPLGATVAPTPEADRIAPAFRRIRLQQAITDFLREALTDPTILVVEDVDWLDNASRDLLSDLLLGMFDRPWCLVLTGTSVDEADTDADILQLDLPALPDDAIRRLAIHALGDHSLHPHDLDRLVDTAAGHALFLLELVAKVRAGESVDKLPRTIEATVTSRLDALPPADLALLRQAAVVGSDVTLDVVAAVLGPEAADPGRWAGMGAFVSVENGRLRFVEPLYQQVAYDGIAYALRADLHARAADVLAGTDADDLPTLANLARHAEGSGRHELAWEANVRAGDAMRNAWAIVDAVEHYERALVNVDHLPNLPPDELAAVAERLGDVAEIASLHAEAVTAYGRALAATSNPLAAARLERKTAESLRNTGDFEAAEQQLLRGLSRIDGMADAASMLERSGLLVEQARLRFRQGRFTEVADLVKIAETEVAEADAPHEVLGQLAFVRASGLMQVNDPGAKDGLRTALDHYEATPDLIGRGHCHTNLGIVAYYAGDWDQALDHYRRAQSLYTDAGYVLGAATSAFNFGEVCAQQGKITEAVTWFEGARRQYQATHNQLGIAATVSYLAWSKARVGDLDEAEIVARQAAATLDELGAEDHASSARVRLAEILAHDGRGGDAEAVLEEVLSARPAAVILSSALRVKGLALTALDRLDAAQAAFARAYQLARDEDLPYEAALAAQALVRLGGDAENETTEDLAAFAQGTLGRLGVLPFEDPTVTRAIEGATSDRLRGRFDRSQARLAKTREVSLPDDAAPDRSSHQVDLEDLTVEYRRGHYLEVLTRLQDLAPALSLADADIVARATLLRASAAAHLHHPKAAEALEEAIRQFSALGDNRGAGMAHANLAALHVWEGTWDAALEELAEATRLYEEAGEERLATVQRVNEAEILMSRGEGQAAQELLEGAIEVYRSLTYPLGMAYAMIGLGTIHLEDDPFAAQEHLEQAASMLEQIGAEDMLAKARATLAAAMVDQGEVDRPRDLLAQVLEETEDPEVRALALRVRGMLHLDDGDAEAAADDLRSATEVAKGARLQVDEAKALLALSRVPGLEREERVAAGRKARDILGRLGVVMTRP